MILFICKPQANSFRLKDYNGNKASTLLIANESSINDFTTRGRSYIKVVSNCVTSFMNEPVKVRFIFFHTLVYKSRNFWQKLANISSFWLICGSKIWSHNSWLFLLTVCFRAFRTTNCNRKICNFGHFWLAFYFDL